MNKFPIAKKQSIITECDWSDSIWEKEHNNLTIDLACDASIKLPFVDVSTFSPQCTSSIFIYCSGTYGNENKFM